MLGFQRQSTREPFPEDRPMRVGSIEHEEDTFCLHVHVIPAGSEEVNELRNFRDRLRSDAGLLESYVERKKRIIEAGTTDSVDYAEAKGSFIIERCATQGRAGIVEGEQGNRWSGGRPLAWSVNPGGRMIRKTFGS